MTLGADVARTRLALDKALVQGQPGQVGPAAVAGLVPDTVKVGANGPGADVELSRDLRVGQPQGDQGDKFPLSLSEPARAGPFVGRPGFRGRLGEQLPQDRPQQLVLAGVVVVREFDQPAG